jgi:hypothetical protein
MIVRKILTSNQIIALSLIFVILRGFALYQVVTHPDVKYTRDSYEYKNAAINLITENTLYSGDLKENINPALYSRRPPVYPIFLIFPGLIFLSDLFIILVQNILNILIIFLILKILQMYNFSQNINFWIIIIFLIYPTQIIYSNLIMTEILLQTVLVAALYFILKYFLMKKIKYLFYFNLLLAIGVLLKPVLFYFWIVNLLFHVWLYIQHRRRIIILLSLILLISIASWALRNYFMTDYFHFSSIKQFNLLYYNTSSFLINTKGVDYASKTINTIDSVSQTLPFPEANKFIENECFEIIIKHWWSYGIYHLRGVLFFFLDPGRYDFYNFFDIELEKGFFHYITSYGMKGIFKLLGSIPIYILFFLGIIFIFNFVLFIAFIIFTLRNSVPFYLKLTILIFISYFAVLTGPIGASRFKLPLFPFLLIAFAWIFRPLMARLSKEV